MGLTIKDPENGKPLSYLKHPDERGQVSGLRALITSFLAPFLPFHCGKLAKKVKPGANWHSSTYKCKKCGLEFWTWTETG